MSLPKLQFEWTIDNQSTTILFDASIKEEFDGTAQIPDHPVEKGQGITDNIRPMPDVLRVTAMVTNTPIVQKVFLPSTASQGQSRALQLKPGQKYIGIPSPPPPAATVLQFNSAIDRVTEVTSALVGAKNLGALITITTSLRTYEEYAIEHVGIPRDAQNGTNAVILDVSLKQIRTVSVAVTEAAPSTQQKPKQRGAKQTREADATEKNQAEQSFGAAAFDAWGAR